MTVAREPSTPARADEPPARTAKTLVGGHLRVAAGWLVLAVALGLVLPVFGVLSPVTWVASAIGWLWVIVVPAVTAAVWGRRRWWPGTASMVLLTIAASGAIIVVGPPTLTPEAYVTVHRAHLAALAEDFRNGSITGSKPLPLSMRALSTDGMVHVRCGDGQCGLFLSAWQDWRAESGVGFAYFSHPPRPHKTVVTASGDVGTIDRELGDGWWWVDPRPGPARGRRRGLCPHRTRCSGSRDRSAGTTACTA